MGLKSNEYIMKEAGKKQLKSEMVNLSKTLTKTMAERSTFLNH
jgi:hypothetical protein